jgi:Xaa-Pro dipeptidase
MNGIPWELRLIKSPAEIAYIRRAAGIADQTMSDAIAMAQPGISERQVAALVARRFVEQGADPGHIGPITAARGWGFLHGHLHDTALTAGDVLHLELVPRVHGYSARLMRCIAIGGISEEQRRNAERIVEIQDRQIAAMRPGARASEVDRILRDGLIATGLRESYDNITGYTLGYYSQQPLRSSDFTRTFNPKAEWALEAGMVFHMYTSACGLAFSETVHVTAEGPERLTRIERRLFSS